MPCYVRFRNRLEKLNVDPEALYAALVADAEVDSPNWDLAGRQANIWKKFGMKLNEGTLH